MLSFISLLFSHIYTQYTIETFQYIEYVSSFVSFSFQLFTVFKSCAKIKFKKFPLPMYRCYIIRAVATGDNLLIIILFSFK